MRQVAEYCGLQVNRKGLCSCPFHAETSPSLKIYPNGKGFFCFGCGAGGDQVKFLALYRDVSNYEAAKELAEAFGIPVSVPSTYREKREAGLRPVSYTHLDVYKRQQIRSACHNYQMHHQLREQIQQIQEQHLNSLRVLNDNLQNLKDSVQCFLK